MSTRSSPTSSRRSRSATCTMPSGSQAPEPSASLVLGHAEEDDGGHAEVGQLGHLLAQRLAGVLHHPGQRGDRLRARRCPRARTAGPPGRRPRGGSRRPGGAGRACGAGAAAGAGGSSPSTGSVRLIPTERRGGVSPGPTRSELCGQRKMSRECVQFSAQNHFGCSRSGVRVRRPRFRRWPSTQSSLAEDPTALGTPVASASAIRSATPGRACRPSSASAWRSRRKSVRRWRSPGASGSPMASSSSSVQCRWAAPMISIQRDSSSLTPWSAKIASEARTDDGLRVQDHAGRIFRTEAHFNTVTRGQGVEPRCRRRGRRRRRRWCGGRPRR
jgi:hypothetical protein